MASKRGVIDAARRRPVPDVQVSERDREAAKRFVHDYNMRDIFQAREGPVEDLADIIAQARAEERAEILERVRLIEADCRDGNLSPLDVEAAIRARGEK